MLVNFSNVQNIFIVCGRTDMRCGIDGLAGIITDKYNLDLFNDALFLFCGRKKDRYKALYWDRDGFILLYKRIENGNLQWPRNQEEVKQLTNQELRWLLEGLSISQPKAIKPAKTGCIV
ncbi:IS66 family insertion sequence element accessory protein TnpB [Turicibacter sanguinis]|uniref:IS66 family insertion sequence element accessory protein TnpB n=1 Tax=Turicibacter sanguinis TaxID=154288 RepID=UPI0018A9BD01|nr:IS66 family insertion sequence element accessory protein TnpB [Turicibacter sanguinis]MDB8558547.1 IS66 family insertion sequence element accessory protein TnpB [Turicibacter sanguinis]MDB8561343.1 IS66 family insertion sequence element accessory protein TnpB [Turicibacter sanguinis]